MLASALLETVASHSKRPWKNHPTISVQKEMSSPKGLRNKKKTRKKFINFVFNGIITCYGHNQVKETKLKQWSQLFLGSGNIHMQTPTQTSQGLWTLFSTYIDYASTASINLQYWLANCSLRESFLPVACSGETVNQGVLPGPSQRWPMFQAKPME